MSVELRDGAKIVVTPHDLVVTPFQNHSKQFKTTKNYFWAWCIEIGWNLVTKVWGMVA